MKLTDELEHRLYRAGATMLGYSNIEQDRLLNDLKDTRPLKDRNQRAKGHLEHCVDYAIYTMGQIGTINGPDISPREYKWSESDIENLEAKIRTGEIKPEKRIKLNSPVGLSYSELVGKLKSRKNKKEMNTVLRYMEKNGIKRRETQEEIIYVQFKPLLRFTFRKRIFALVISAAPNRRPAGSLK